MGVVTIAVAAVGTAGSIAGIGTGLHQWIDAQRSKQVERLNEFPFFIGRPVSHHDYRVALHRIKDYIEEQRLVPDYVVGIHYGGITSASDLGRHFYKPLRLITTHFDRKDNHTVCQKVTPQFALSEVSGKRVLLVDNRIYSGRTMRMACDLLKSAGAVVTTLVIFRPAIADGTSDIALFASKKRGMKEYIK